jgi:hypothetical protein
MFCDNISQSSAINRTAPIKKDVAGLYTHNAFLKKLREQVTESQPFEYPSAPELWGA